MPKRHSRSSRHGFWNHSKQRRSQANTSRLRSRRALLHRRGLTYEELEPRALLATLQHSLFPDLGPQAGANTGFSVATDGNFYVVGSPLADVGGVSDGGMVRVFNAATGALVTTLNNPSPGTGGLFRDLFGWSVAVSGNTVVVGAMGDETGASDPEAKGDAPGFSRVAQNVNAGADQTVNEGATVNLSGSFTDPGSADTHTQTWSVASTNGQVIANGSGGNFSFVPNDNGTLYRDLHRPG